VKRFYATWREHEWVVVDREDDSIVDRLGTEPWDSRDGAIVSANLLNTHERRVNDGLE
jgi:hypothetical protein